MSDKNYLSVYAKSFNWAGFFLPKKTYKDCSDLYDFCRTLDDIADQDLDLRIKKKIFEEFKRDFESKNIENPIINKVNIKSDEIEEFLKKPNKEKFDIIFLDPPFKDKNLNSLLAKLEDNKLLNENGTIILHRHKSDNENFSKSFKIIEEKNYGISKISFLGNLN